MAIPPFVGKKPKGFHHGKTKRNGEQFIVTLWYFQFAKETV